MVEASADLDIGFERFEGFEGAVLQICRMLEPMPRSLSRWKTVTHENLRERETLGILYGTSTHLISENLGMAVDPADD